MSVRFSRQGGKFIYTSDKICSGKHDKEWRNACRYSLEVLAGDTPAATADALHLTIIKIRSRYSPARISLCC
jgi:hypothetical protein